jgi:hypothetical protein
MVDWLNKVAIVTGGGSPTSTPTAPGGSRRPSQTVAGMLRPAPSTSRKSTTPGAWSKRPPQRTADWTTCSTTLALGWVVMPGI